MEGQGVIIGAEQYNGDGKLRSENDPKSSVEEIRGKTRFATYDEAKAWWDKENARLEAARFGTIEGGGNVVEHLAQTLGE